MLLKDKKTELDYGVFYTSCSTTFEEDIFFMFEGKWLQIKGKDLVVDLSEEQDRSLCAITFMPTSNEFWWFGHNIYKDYYVVHNMSQRTMGWVPTVDRIKESIKVGARPVNDFPSYDWVMMLIKLAVGAVMGVAYWAII